MASNVNYVEQFKDIYNQPDWVIVRSYDEFVNHITENGIPDLISFDHDLGIEHIQYYFNNVVEKTGKDCAKWLVDYCIDNQLELPKYYVHSANPIGRQNIINYLENFKKNYK